MPVDTEKEITKIHKTLQSTQNEIGKTYYRWRQVAIEFAGEDTKPQDVALRAAEVFGKDIGKSLLPRMNWLKGEEGFLMILARSLAGLWNTEGGLATVEKGENPGEIFIRCTRDPWPTWAKEYGASMEEVALCRERMYQTILEDVGLFMNVSLKIELQKAISRGEGETVMKLFKAE
ncbi:MAG: hypothetical protein PVH28_11240 [Desulfobacterales bacterium]|jgi:hypothetical protein